MILPGFADVRRCPQCSLWEVIEGDHAVPVPLQGLTDGRSRQEWSPHHLVNTVLSHLSLLSGVGA